MRRSLLLVPALVLALLPLRDSADQTTCCNVTTSLASTLGGPVDGDEQFFKLPSGPSNVMFLLDTSGSMDALPQCGDYSWDAGTTLATCKSPTFTVSAPTNSNSSPTYKWAGTCLPATGTASATYTYGTFTASSSLAWMETVPLKTTYADPGHTNALLWDCPPWGNGGAGCGTKICSGSGCLFDPTAYYLYGDWKSSGGGGPSNLWPTTTRRELDSVATATTTEPTAACTALDDSGNVIIDWKSKAPVNLGSTCSKCMSDHGFYIYRIQYYDSSSHVNDVTNVLFKGTFLNGNPPKFVTSRRTLKDVAWMDPSDPSNLDQVRMGFAILDSGGSSPRKSQLIVPLGPDMAGSYPPTQAGFRQARQYILSALNYDTSVYKDSGGNVIVDGSTTGSTGFQYGFFDPGNGSTPLGSALLNLGQYFTAVSPSLYTNLFGATGCGGGSCVTTEFAENAAGRTNAAWVKKSGNVQHSICWGCQASSIVVITDGSPNSEITFPATINSYGTSTYALAANCNGSYAANASVPTSDTTFRCTQPTGTRVAAGVPRVADWIHTMASTGKLAPNGLRYDVVLGGGQRALSVDTIGFNVTDPSAQAILNATASMGGGVYENVADDNALEQAVYNAVQRITPKNVSFSAATSNSLQTVQTAASQAFVTRFRPNTQNTWEGHVFEVFLFDEFLNGCDPSLTTQPTVTCGQAPGGTKTIPANYFSGTNDCTGTFLIDLDCDQVIEDQTTGNFIKKGTTTLAKVPWDAGQVLSYESFPGGTETWQSGANPYYHSADETAGNARNIFTWIGGTRVSFTGANAATIQPYLNISPTWCASLLTQLGIPGGSNSMLECAKQIIYYVRGWDVLDQDSDKCAGPDNPANTSSCQRGTKGEERDRPMDGNGAKFFWKLGDISHSSPAVLQAPIDEIRCDTGYEKQCSWAVRSPVGVPNQTPMDSSCPHYAGVADCYQDYRNTNVTRRRVLVVGSNDGMLHGFDAGSPTGTPDVTGAYAYTIGTGEELWAFVPPDLLPRLKDLMTAHQYMVDGSVMLRDIWVDGSTATDGLHTPTAPSGADGYKQTREFHTVAIFGRRSGGTQYTALDVTNPVAPTFLWNFPPGGSDDSRYMGQSWAEFAPRPPPIVPVKLAITNTSPAPDNARGFAEKWVVMFGGGYDPSLTLGRAVFMVDAWTGTTVWRFTDDDFKTTLSFSGANAPSMFPVTAAPAALDIGDTSKPNLDVDGFSDTATWGDLGGNLFVARFADPGVIDTTTGRVNNWFAARAFEEARRTDDAQYVSAGGATRNEFFFMTANAWDGTTHTIHTYVGSGDRERLMNQSAACGTDNVFGCCQAGCTNVTATTTENYGACSHSDTFSCVNGLLTHSETNTCGASGASCAASPGLQYAANVNLSFTCPGSSTTVVTGSGTCDVNGLCSLTPVAATQVSGTFTAPSHNRFYGVVSWGGVAGTRTFNTQATAKVFDQNRFTDGTFTGTCNWPGTSSSCVLVNTSQAQVTVDLNHPSIATTACADSSAKCWATSSDPGWYYEYGDVCPLASCPTNPPWTDEKTGAGGNVVLGCATWNGFRPYGVTTSTDPCNGQQGAPTVYDYSANYISGQPSGSCNGATGTAGQAYIATQRTVTAAPGGTIDVLTMRADGKVNYSGLQLDSGSIPSSNSYGILNSLGTSLYWLEVPQSLHQCRHGSAANCK